VGGAQALLRRGSVACRRVDAVVAGAAAGFVRFPHKGQEMESLLLLLGRLAGIGGLALCVVAAVARLQGNFYLGAMQVGTLLQAGVAAIVIACFFLLLGLVSQGKADRSR